MLIMKILYTHLRKFYEHYETLTSLEAEEDAIFVRLFLHSLIRKEKNGISINLRK